MKQLNCDGEMIPMTEVLKLRSIGGGNLFVVLRGGRMFTGKAGEKLAATDEDLDPVPKMGRRAYVLTKDGPKEVQGQVPNNTVLGEGGRVKMSAPEANK